MTAWYDGLTRVAHHVDREPPVTAAYPYKLIVQGDGVIHADALRSEFANLDFDIPDSADGEQSFIGFAPSGRVGVIEVSEIGGATRVSLLVSVASVATKRWSGIYVATIADIIGVDFGEWVTNQIQHGGMEEPWHTATLFGATLISVCFHPTDSILVTVWRPDLHVTS